MNSLGNCLRDGKGIDQNLKQAVVWYQGSASFGNPDGMLHLGNCLREGKGTAQNLEQAVEWYHRSADLGNSNAMLLVGRCLQNGSGIPKNEVEAVEWYRRAADLGNSYAMCSLGLCLENGTGIAQNAAEAVELFYRSADLENPKAMGHLIKSLLRFGEFEEVQKWIVKVNTFDEARAKDGTINSRRGKVVRSSLSDILPGLEFNYENGKRAPIPQTSSVEGATFCLVIYDGDPFAYIGFVDYSHGSFVTNANGVEYMCFNRFIGEPFDVMYAEHPSWNAEEQ
jgi:TPR repeat protein